MLKKYTSILIIFSLLFSLLCVTAYAAEPESSDDSYLEVLKSLEIVCGYEKEETKPFSVMKKNTFINFLMNITDGAKYSSSYDTGALNAAQSMGIIDSAAQIGESDVLLKNEAIKMAMCLLGYKEMCIFGGGYPTGYLAKAENIGLTKNIDLSNEIKNKEAFELLYNIIDVGIAEISTIGNGDDGDFRQYSVYKDKSVLSLYRHIYSIEGVVTANCTSGLYDSEPAPYAKAEIDNELFNDPCDLLYEYLGYDVKAWAKELPNNDYEVICVMPGESNTIKFSTEDIASITDDLRTFEFYTSEDLRKTKKKTVLASASLLYNGVVCGDYSEDDFKKSGNVILVDNDSDGKYDVIKLDVGENMIVSSVSVSANSISGEYSYDGCLNRIELDQYDGIGDRKEFYLDGKKAEFTDIQAGDVLTVFASKQGENKRIAIYISKNRVSAAVNEYDESKTEVTLGSVVYELSDDYIKARDANEALAQEIIPGSKYTFYIDTNGKIAGAKSEKGSMTYAYVKDVSFKKNGVNTEMAMRVYGTDGEWKNLEFAEKININGESAKASERQNQIESAKDGIIGYTSNSEGKVNRLELPVEYYEGISSERLNTVGSKGHNFRYNNTTFDCYYYMTGSTKVIKVPSSDSQKDKEELYSTGNNYSFTSNSSVSYVGYDNDEYNCLGIVLVKCDDSQVKQVGNGNYFVRRISKVPGKSGDTTQLVLASKAYFGLSIRAEDPFVTEGVHPGDIVKIHVNSNGYIDNLSPVYRISSGNIKEKDTNLNGYTTVKGEVLKVDYEGGRILIDSSSQIALMVSSVSVLIYDAKNEEMSVGSLGEVCAGDYVIADIDECKVLALYIIRNFK